MKIALGYKYRPPHLPILDVIKPNSRREGALAQRSGARRASGKMRVPVSGGAVESGVRPEESNPWGRGSSGSYAARWGACAWPLRKEDPGSRSEEAVCVWGGAPPHTHTASSDLLPGSSLRRGHAHAPHRAA